MSFDYRKLEKKLYGNLFRLTSAILLFMVIPFFTNEFSKQIFLFASISLFLSIITESLIYYLSLAKVNFKKNKLKYIFIVLFVVLVILSFLLYYSIGICTAFFTAIFAGLVSYFIALSVAIINNKKKK